MNPRIICFFTAGLLAMLTLTLAETKKPPIQLLKQYTRCNHSFSIVRDGWIISGYGRPTQYCIFPLPESPAPPAELRKATDVRMLATFASLLVAMVVVFLSTRGRILTIFLPSPEAKKPWKWFSPGADRQAKLAWIAALLAHEAESNNCPLPKCRVRLWSNSLEFAGCSSEAADFIHRTILAKQAFSALPRIEYRLRYQAGVNVIRLRFPGLGRLPGFSLPAALYSNRLRRRVRFGNAFCPLLISQLQVGVENLGLEITLHPVPEFDNFDLDVCSSHQFPRQQNFWPDMTRAISSILENSVNLPFAGGFTFKPPLRQLPSGVAIRFKDNLGG